LESSRSFTVSTTTICLEDDLISRIAAAAERASKTAHAYIIEAIARGERPRKPAARQVRR